MFYFFLLDSTYIYFIFKRQKVRYKYCFCAKAERTNFDYLTIEITNFRMTLVFEKKINKN